MKLLFISFLLLSLSCGGTQKRAQSDVPMHQPPTDDSVIMPKGAPMVARDIATLAVAEDGALMISKKDFNRFIDKGPGFAFTLFELEPKKKGTEMVGYEIKQIGSSARPYVADALLVDDVVTHLNGMPIGTPEKYFEAWKSLGTSSKIRIDFSRADVAQHLIWVVVDGAQKPVSTEPISN